MRYSSIIALALASAVVALPTQHSPPDTSSSDPGSEEPAPAPKSYPITHPTGGQTHAASGTGSSFVPTATGVHPASQTGSPDLPKCGLHFYHTNAYVCYNNIFLCPIIGGTPHLLCGETCYSESLHCCKNGVVTPKTRADETCTDNTGSTDPATDTSGDAADTTGDTESECSASASTSTASTSTASTAPESTSTASTAPASTGTGSPNPPSTAPANTDTNGGAETTGEGTGQGPHFTKTSASDTPDTDKAGPPATPGQWRSVSAGVAISPPQPPLPE